MVTKTTIIGIVILLILAIAGIIFVGLQSTLFSIDFAGFSFKQVDVCGTFNVQKDGEFLLLTSNNGEGVIEADVTGVDELLVIFEGDLMASCGGSSGGNADSGISGAIIGSISGSVGEEESVSTNRCQNSVGDTIRKVVEPAIWKFRNNFDGTWSSLESIGVGDIFIARNTQEILGNPRLRLSISGSKPFGCFGGGSQSDTSSRGTLRIFNIIRKEDAFALCKADEFLQDVNMDGKFTSDECFDLKTIVLNSEEAIKESFDEKIIRITAELEAKNEGLTNEIELLKQKISEGQVDSQEIILLKQQITDLEDELASLPPSFDDTELRQRIDELKIEEQSLLSLQERVDILESELEQTKIIIKKVESGDKEVVATIESNERFEFEEKIGKLTKFIIGITIFILVILGLLLILFLRKS